MSSFLLLTYVDYLYILYVDNLYMERRYFMSINKNLISGSTTMLLLKLLEDRDMYGYQMIETLANQSNDTFSLKAGTLYPLLHNLEDEGMVNSYEKVAENGRTRKYYSITKRGRGLLAEKENEWRTYVAAINQVLQGGANYGILH